MDINIPIWQNEPNFSSLFQWLIRVRFPDATIVEINERSLIQKQFFGKRP